MHIIALRCVHHWTVVQQMTGRKSGNVNIGLLCSVKCTPNKKKNGILKFYKRSGSLLGEVRTYDNTTAARRLILFVSCTTCRSAWCGPRSNCLKSNKHDLSDQWLFGSVWTDHQTVAGQCVLDVGYFVYTFTGRWLHQRNEQRRQQVYIRNANSLFTEIRPK